MRGSKRLPVMIYGSLLVISIILMILFWHKAAGYIAAAAACLWVFLLILPVLREEKRRNRKYHIFIPLAKHQPALPGSTKDTEPEADGQKEELPESPETPSAMTAEDNPTPENSAPGTSASYIGHAESRKFHTPQCTSLPREKNRVYLSTREEAITRGFSPCTYCKP
jgi:hypothetical protein